MKNEKEQQEEEELKIQREKAKKKNLEGLPQELQEGDLNIIMEG